MELTRRSVLRGASGLLGLSALELAGCGAPRRAPVAGGFADPAADRGHLLRTGDPGGEPTSVERAGVVVVGGGAAGLSAAWRLARCGVSDVVVLELDDGTGGTSASGANSVSAHPWGAHYVPVPTQSQRALCELLADVGAIRGFDAAGVARADDLHLCRDPEERLFHAGMWVEGLYPHDGASDDDLAQLARFRETCGAFAARRDARGRRAFALPVASSSQDSDLLALDRIPFSDWLAREGFTSPRLLWYAEYGCRDDFGASLAGTSAWAGLHYHAARVAPGGGDAAPVLTWPEGNAFLVRAMERAAAAGGASVRTGAVALSVVEHRGGASVTWIDARSGDRRRTDARHVVCAVPRFVARRIVPALSGESGGFVYAPWVVANLTLREDPVGHGFATCWDNVIHGSPSLGYVVATHQSDRRERDTVWTWYRPFTEPDAAAVRMRLSGSSWEEWRDRVLADLRPAHPDIEEYVTRIDVRRWGHGMVRPGPGFVWGEARRGAAERRGAISFAGADVGGLPLFEEAQWAGVRAAEEAMAALGHRFESWL
ncbi:MAG: hypothetical protein HMLKMBBP_02287 [Planctomycetes bacterium]|nr:hypothetical protein [Planctomycetota bacterium]